jgi:hypothetical protein
MEVIGSVSSSIVRLNEQAVEQLCAEAYDRAQATLKAALTLFRRGLAAQDTLALEENGEEVKEEKEDGDDDDDDSEADRTGSNEWEAKALELVAAPEPPDPIDGPPVGDVGVALVSLGVSHPPYTTTPNADHRTSSYYLINMAMVFACDDREEEENLGIDDVILFASSRNSARATAVLCYNLAMTYHLRALAMSHGSHHPQRASHLNKALRVYDLVLNPPTGLVDVGGSRRRHRRVDASSIRIRAALYNNKGHAHHCLQETDRVKACVRALSMWAIDDDDGDAEEQEEEREGSTGGASIARALGDAALPVALNVHLHSRGQNIHPASSA